MTLCDVLKHNYNKYGICIRCGKTASDYYDKSSDGEKKAKGEGENS